MLKTCLLTLFIKSDKSLNKSLKVGDATNECLILWDFCYLFWYAPTMSLQLCWSVSLGEILCGNQPAVTQLQECPNEVTAVEFVWFLSVGPVWCGKHQSEALAVKGQMTVCLWVRVQRKYLFLPPEWIKWVIIFFKKKEILKTFWLIIQCNTVAFFCCNQTALKFNILYAQKCSSVYIG